MFISQIRLFLIICFGFSWALAVFAWWHGDLSDTHFLALTIGFMCGPMIAALVCAWLFDRSRWKQALGFTSRPRWIWLGGIGLGALIVAGSTALSLLGQDVNWGGLRAILLENGASEEDVSGMANDLLKLQLYVLPINFLFNSLFAFFEELGWRGWLYDRWRKYGFWKGNLLIGLVWGLWSAPLIAMGYNYSGQPAFSIFLMIVYCLLRAPIMGWMREVGHSVFASSLFRASIETLSGVGLLALGFPEMPWRGVMGIGGFIMLAGIYLALLGWTHNQRKLGQ